MKSQKFRLFSFIYSVLFYFLYLSLIDYQNLSNGYKITILLPIVYILCFHLMLWNPTLRIRSPYFIMFSIIAFIRYVVLSILTIQNGGYDGISGIPVRNENLTLAGILMMWELICTSGFINYWSRHKIDKIRVDHEPYSSKANTIIYMLFVIFSTMLLFVFPESRKGISFFSNITYALNDDFDSLLNLGIREMFVNAKYFLLFLVVINLQKKNGTRFKKNKLLSYATILLFVVLTIGIRVGSNRKKMISDAVAALLLLWNLFPKYKKITGTTLLIVGTVFVISTSVYRGMTTSAGDFFSSYLDLDTFQQYFLGQYNIGIAIEAKNIYPEEITLNSFVIGVLRPLFGIGSLVKNTDIRFLDHLFDERMSMGLNFFRGDQILPLIAEGYMFLGMFLSPLFSVIIARIGVLFDNLYFHTKNIEVLFITSLISFYLAQGMILNTTIILNMLSFRLAIYLPIYLLGKLRKQKVNNRLIRISV